MSVDTWRRVQFVLVAAMIICWTVVMVRLYVQDEEPGALLLAAIAVQTVWVTGRAHFKRQREHD